MGLLLQESFGARGFSTICRDYIWVRDEVTIFCGVGPGARTALPTWRIGVGRVLIYRDAYAGAAMSALHSEADITEGRKHVRCGPKTEVAGYSTTVYEANSSSKPLASFYLRPPCRAVLCRQRGPTLLNDSHEIPGRGI